MKPSREARARPRRPERMERAEIRPPVEPPSYRPPYLAAGLAALAVWSLYALTLARTTQFWDTSEYIATAHILGIPHPPGNPLFVVLTRAWELLLAPFGLSVAVRVNLFSATMSALAHGFWFLLAHRILAFYSASRAFRLVGAALAVLLSATAFTVWNQSNVNEKVYTVSLFTIALLSWLAFRWRDNLGQGKDDNLILLMVFILALSVGNHLMAFLAAPALFLFILLIEPRTLSNWRLYVAGAVVAVLGLSIHLFLPLRAGLDPVINEADPSCASVAEALKSILTYGQAGCQALSESLTRQQYDKPSMFSSPLDRRLPRDLGLMAAQVVNYLQYFDWQWARSIAGNQALFGGIRWLFTLLFAALGVYGAWSHYRRDRTSWMYLAVLLLTLSAGLVFYLNFKYGYSYARERFPDPEMHEVRERDYFFIVGFSVWGLWAGTGLVVLWQRAADWVAARWPRVQRPRALATPTLALGFIPLVLNWGWASRAHDFAARDWAYNLLMSVEPYAVLFTNGDNDTFPLWYLQEVEGVRRDVTVIVMSYLNTPWYVKQLKQLTAPCPAGSSPAADPTRIICQRPYAGELEQALGAAPVDRPGRPAPGLSPSPRAPAASIIQLTDEQVDQIAGMLPSLTQEPLQIRASSITTTVPAGSIMIPADWFLAAIVTSALDDRPIYFATTTQAYDELNLRPFLIRRGVAFKLSDGPVEADTARGIYRVPTSPWTPVLGQYVDLPATEWLLRDVFAHRRGFPEQWDRWVDAATQGIPFYYAYPNLALAQIYGERQQQEKAEYHIKQAEAWLALGQK
ncbi:MAG: DUF2723 domain-containing protein [Gemmatimonadetes bacterium]|nr:DUF2723 domain-containing protein [Gemmatimonadota bacterium]